MDGMITINVQLSITRENGKVILEMVGQCEKEHKKLALFIFVQDIDKYAKKFGAEKIEKEVLVEPHQFYRGFIFPNEEKMDEFLEDLQKKQ